LGLPHIRTLVVREKIVRNTSKKRFKVTAGKPPAGKPAAAAAAVPAAGAEEADDSVSYFLGSRLPGPAQAFAQLIRGHWGGCEIRNHGTRDVQWKEDKTLSGHWALNACLAILRVALLSVRFRQGVTLPWPQIFERCNGSSVPAMSLINGKSIK
jgi:hypothetical protein